MTTDCMTDRRLVPADRTLHDAILGVVVAVVLIIPATLAAVSFFHA